MAEQILGLNILAMSANSSCCNDLSLNPLMEPVDIFGFLLEYLLPSTHFAVCKHIYTIAYFRPFCLFRLFLRYIYYCYIHKFIIIRSVRRV